MNSILQSQPSPSLQSPTNNSTPLTNNVRQYLITMVRFIAAACCGVCLYFLVMCAVTTNGQITTVEDQLGSKSQSEMSKLESSISSLLLSRQSENLKYESSDQIDGDDQQVQNVIEAILDSSQDQSRQIKAKLSRLLAKVTTNSRQKSEQHQQYHRYSVEPTDGASSIEESYADCAYHLAFTLMMGQSTNEHHYPTKLMNKFTNSLSSILSNLNSTNLDSGSLCVHLITDDPIRPYVRDTIAKVHEDLVRKSNQHYHNSHNSIHRHHFRGDGDSQTEHQEGDVTDNASQWTDEHRPLTRYFFIDSAVIESHLDYLLPTLRSYFTHKPNSYYSNALFFYSLVLHRVIPKTVADRLILLDVDVQLDANLLELYEEFGRFKPDQVIGIGYEQQPVYRHILHEYRRDNENSTIGSASPNGFPGFNSGVLLLHLRKLRESKLYNSLLNPVIISHLCRKYRFRGHLGDQDFYTATAFDFRQLFHQIPCGWNRQLCQWWRFHGYGSVFDDYHRCDSTIKLYHGNCNSALPSLPSYGEYRR